MNGFGPHDYRVEQGQNRKIVEDYHFTPRVESLISGVSASLGSDIDYTLRAFPNHHRALVSMMNLGARTKRAVPPGAQYSVECYFKRAVQFRPDDTIARMIYAKFLASSGRKPDAHRQLDFALQGAKDNAFTNYNAGLIYFEMGEFDKALAQAHRAQSLGFDRQGGLKQQLQTAGKWTEAPAQAPSEAASASASAPPASAATGASAP
ncbi:MAG: ABC transporter permease [Rubrivivax sp.]|nr:ABC transporter permease [Rubrivivax sp.]MDP3612015.1 ABC transporter permease [Rubrivivax sp.]